MASLLSASLSNGETFALTSQHQTDRLDTRMVSPFLAAPYLPHLNGLRALAILGVLLYHLREVFCPAGYFGVDMFLVLSGFLLLRGLLPPEGAGASPRPFRYGRFLLRKAWRTLPSWLAVMTLTCLVSLLLLHPATLSRTMLTAATSSVFLADCFIDHSGDYFNPLSQQNPLLHFWYLSITQQLYLVAPLLIIPVARLCSRRTACVLLGGLGLLSFVFYLLTAAPGPLGEALLRAVGARSAYYHLLPRFWEVAAGAAVFLLPDFAARPGLRALPGLLGLLGLVGAAASFYLYDTGSTAVYMAVCCTLLIIRYAGEGPAARLLSLRPVQALGRVSFSLYLWHWPLMVFWKYCRFDVPGPLDDLGMLAASLLLAFLGWRYLESRRPPEGPGWKPRLQHMVLLLSLPLVGFATLHSGLRTRQFAPRGQLGHTVLIHHAVQETEPAVLRGLERLPALQLIGKPLRVGAAEGAPRFLLLGDSHAQHLYDALHSACAEAGLRGLYLNNTVAPYHGLIQPQVGADTCRWNPEIEQALLDYLAAHPGITHVLMAQCWQMRMGEGHGIDGRTGATLSKRRERHAVTGPGLGLFCDRIRELGRVPVLLGETPRFSRPYPLEEWHRRELLGVPQRERRMTREDFEKRHAFPLATLRALAQEGRAELVELTPALLEEDAFPAHQGSEFWYYDANHLTPRAARRVVERCILPRLREMLRAVTSPH